MTIRTLADLAEPACEQISRAALGLPPDYRHEFVAFCLDRIRGLGDRELTDQRVRSIVANARGALGLPGGDR